jgi:hypothetical protein
MTRDCFTFEEYKEGIRLVSVLTVTWDLESANEELGSTSRELGE